ncbi:MAG: DUF4386 family protein [Chloroflexota bacterium]
MTHTYPDPQHSDWKTLYRLGGVAPLLTIVFYLSEFLLISWDKFPASTEAWYALFQSNRLLGLFYLNALDIISIALLGVMFLAIYRAIHRLNPSWMSVAAFFGLLGVGVFIVPRVAMLSMLTLSDQYAAAASQAQRASLLAAGDALGSLGTATPQTVGFLFMAVAVLIISIVMLRGPVFGKINAWAGMLASALTIVDHLSLYLAPALAMPLMVSSGIFWLGWWSLTGLGLLRLARLEPRPLS